MRTLLFVAAAAFIVSVIGTEEKDLSHGFGEDIEWVSWDNALELAKEQNKPVFLLIHKTWCGACKALKKNFKGSNKRTELVQLSKKFVMVNLEDDEEPEDERYAPDGAYIPRLFFLDKNGDPMAVDNKKNYPNNAYYFPQAVDVLKAMKVALKEFGAGSDESEKDTVKEEKEAAATATAEKKKDEKKKAETVEKKEDKKEKKSEKSEKKEKKEKKEDKAEKKEKKEEKKEKSEKKDKKDKSEKKEKKEDKPEKKEKKEEKKEKKTDKKEKSEKKEDKKQKDTKKETKEKDSKKEKKSDDGKKSKKEGEKKKKTEL